MVDNNSIYYKEEHILLRKMVKEFAQNELAPIAQEIDSQSKFPIDSIKKLSELGLMHSLNLQSHHIKLLEFFY